MLNNFLKSQAHAAAATIEVLGSVHTAVCKNNQNGAILRGGQVKLKGKGGGILG